jgi:TRAP-type C4-dicarboxylate transport system substrate-binding protein
MINKSWLFVIIATIFYFIPFNAQEASAKTYELTFNNHSAPTSSVAKGWEYWADWVNKRSDGKLKITFIHGGALLHGNAVFRGVQTAVADGGQYILDREDGFLLNLVTTLPFMGVPGEKEAGEIYWKLLTKFPEMQAEWKDIKLFGAVIMMPPSQLHTTGKVVGSPADMNSLKIMAAEYMTAQAVNLAGGTAVELDIGEMATSLNTRLIDGVINHFPACGAFGGLEKLKTHTIFGSGGINMTPKVVIMNAKAYDKLPKDLQDILLESGPVAVEKQLELQNRFLAKCLGDAKKWGHTFTNLPPEEIKKWYDMVKVPIHNKWIKECEAKGLPGKAVYDEALRLIRESRTKS